MAEQEQGNTQQLGEFTTNCISDLSSGAITAHEALTAVWQYSYLREELRAYDATLKNALLIGGDEFAGALKNALTEIQSKLSELPNFSGQLPDLPKSEKEIRDVSALRAFAIDRVSSSSASQSPTLSKQRRDFIHTIVSTYSSRTRTEAQIEAAALRAAAQSGSPDEFSRLFVDGLGGTHDMEAGVASLAQKNQEFLQSFHESQVHDGKIMSTLLEHAGVTRPDVLVDVVLHAPQSESLEQSVLRATKLAEVAEALDSAASFPKGKLQFFSSDGARGTTRGLVKGVDGILSLVGEPVREMILAEKVNGTLRNMLTSSQAFVDRLGENVVKSAFFTHITQQMTRQLGERTTSSHQAGSVFGDLVSSIIRGPLNNALETPTQERILDYMELMRANANAPKDKKFLSPAVPVWDVFRPREKQSAASSYQPYKSRVPFFGFGALGNWTSGLFSSAVDSATAFLFTNPRIGGQLSTSRRAASVPIPIGEDMPLFLSIVVIAVLVLLFIFPSNFNLSLLSHSSKVSGLFAALFNKTEDSIGQATLTCANINGAHIRQDDPRWASYDCSKALPFVPACKPPTACVIGLSGCGSTAATIAMNSFGANESVTHIWDKQHGSGGYLMLPANPSEGFSLPYCRSYHEAVVNMVRGAGLSVEPISIEQIDKVLKDCGVVLAVVDEKWENSGPTGHFIVIVGISHEGGTTKVTTLDPMRPANFVSTVTSNPVNNGDINIRGLWSVVK